MASIQGQLKEAKRRLQVAQALHDFVRSQGAGGVTAGRPVNTGHLDYAAGGGMNAAKGGGPAVPVRPHVRSHPLSADQERDRLIRQQAAEQAGVVQHGQAFHAYGPHKTEGADRVLALLANTGSGMTAGQGVARNRQPNVADALARRVKRRRGGGGGGMGGSG
jgi:hypothetical protein